MALKRLIKCMYIYTRQEMKEKSAPRGRFANSHFFVGGRDDDFEVIFA